MHAAHRRSLPRVVVPFVLSGFVWACSAGDTPEGSDAGTVVDTCTVASVTPASVFIEGNETVEVTLREACAGAVTISLAGEPVAVTKVDAMHHTFLAPTHTAGAVTVAVHCGATACGGTSAFTYTDELVDQPVITRHAPVGPRISVLARMSVTFSRRMDPATVTTENFQIVGVPGSIAAADDGKTFTFTPTQVLGYGKTHTCQVTTGVKTALAHKALRTTLGLDGAAADPSFDAWTFTTRDQEDGPFVSNAKWCPPGAPSGVRTLEFSGELRDAEGDPVEGDVAMSISLFDSATGEVKVWTWSGIVRVTAGKFTITLGGPATLVIPDALLGQSLFVGVAVENVAFFPRTVLAPVPAPCP